MKLLDVIVKLKERADDALTSMDKYDYNNPMKDYFRGRFEGLGRAIKDLESAEKEKSLSENITLELSQHEAKYLEELLEYIRKEKFASYWAFGSRLPSILGKLKNTEEEAE